MIPRFIAGFLPENNKYERIWILAKTDFKLRYYDTFLGMIWAMVNPLFRLMIYYLVFSYFFNARIPNYGLHIFSGLIIWMFFQEATKKGINILRSKKYLVENINFNKLDLYTSSLITSLMVFIMNLLVYLIVSLFFDITVNWNILFVPFVILNVCILIYGVNLILSTIHIYLKDISQIWDLVLLGMFWINPIFYAKSLIFEHFPFLIYINPLAGIIINTRAGLMYGEAPDWGIFFFDYAYALVLAGIGLLVFRKWYHKAVEKF